VAAEENCSAADAGKRENRRYRFPRHERKLLPKVDPTVNRTGLLGDHSEREPPDPIPNSEVKPLSADDSVTGCHAKVGNRQALNTKPRQSPSPWVFFRLPKSHPNLMPRQAYSRTLGCPCFAAEQCQNLSVDITRVAIGSKKDKRRRYFFRLGGAPHRSTCSMLGDFFGWFVGDI
jgi:hypothetical protein